MGRGGSFSRPASARQVVLGDVRALAPALEAAAREALGRRRGVPGGRRAEPGYGVIRSIMRGNGMVSRTWWRPQIQATVRSTPRPKPAWGTMP